MKKIFVVWSLALCLLGIVFVGKALSWPTVDAQGRGLHYYEEKGEMLLTGTPFEGCEFTIKWTAANKTSVCNSKDANGTVPVSLENVANAFSYTEVVDIYNKIEGNSGLGLFMSYASKVKDLLILLPGSVTGQLTALWQEQ